MYQLYYFIHTLSSSLSLPVLFIIITRHLNRTNATKFYLIPLNIITVEGVITLYVMCALVKFRKKPLRRSSVIAVRLGIVMIYCPINIILEKEYKPIANRVRRSIGHKCVRRSIESREKIDNLYICKWWQGFSGICERRRECEDRVQDQSGIVSVEECVKTQ